MKLQFGLWQLAAIPVLQFMLAARIFEALTSHARARLAWSERRVRAQPEPWYRMMIAMQALVFAGTTAVVFTRGNIPPVPVFYGATSALGIALLLRGWVFWTLRDCWTERVIDPGSIVTTGPYRFVRHPNYLATIVEVAALPLALGAYEVAILGTLANAILLSWRVPFEERILLQAHPDYRTSMMVKPRFLPGRHREAAHSTSPL
jgi:methyltransferase